MILQRLLMLVFIGVAVCVLGAGVGAAAVITVDDSGGADFTSIQAAVDAASAGDTIEVRSGTYVENVDVGKRLTLIGEAADVVTVIAESADDNVFTVTADHVTISGFTTEGATGGCWQGETYYRVCGIYILGTNYCNIFNNIAHNNYFGIAIGYSANSNAIIANNASNNSIGICIYSFSNNNDLTDNIAKSNNYYAIWLWHSDNNTLTNNTASDNNYGTYLYSSSNNTFHHNNFIDNTNYNAYDIGTNQWDSGSEGNYWGDDYIGTDSNGDGIGDTPYPIPGGSSIDNYPLMALYSPTTSNYEGKLLKQTGDFKVYLIEDGKKLHFTSPEALEWNGHIFADVIEVSAAVMNSFEPGADISITQAIIDKYYVLGGAVTFGLPAGTGEQTGYPDNAGVICTYVNFQNGAIEYFTNGDLAGNAYAILNPFLSKWASMDYANSVLGYPISDMSDVQISKFGTEFKYQHFKNGDELGSLEYNLATGDVYEIHGAIYATWSALGYADSELGAVTSDEQDVVASFKGTTGRVSDFENGHLHWHSSGDHYMVTYMTYGDLDALYVSMGGTDSWLGFPVMHQEDRGGYGYCEFEGGYIEWDGSEYKAIVSTLPTITITSPNGGEEWQAGTTQTIQWSYTGNLGPGVEIEIFNSSGPVQTFTYVSIGSDGSGSYQWLIPDNLVSGTDYQVKITIIGSAYSDTSGYFTISAPSSGFTVGQGASPSIEQLFKNAYDRNGGVGELGEPESDVHEAFGLYQVQNFPGVPGIQGGVLMYNSIQNKVFYLHGAIWDEYYIFPDKAELGPVKEDEKDAAPSQQGTTGRYSKFETGTIHWISDENLDHPQKNKAFITYGGLDKLYTDMGGTFNNWLGFPVMNQTEVNGHGYCEFEGGYIEWDAASGEYLAKTFITMPPRQKVQAFYYSWYGDPSNNEDWIHWNQNDYQPPNDIGADFYPILGPYSSKSADIVDQHMKWLKESGVGVVVVSWWGKTDAKNWNSYIDQSVPLILDKANAYGLKVAWHIEPYDEPYLKRTANTVKDDIIYIYDTYGSHPAFFRDSENGNRAVFYIFESSGGNGAIPEDDWAIMLDSIRGTEYDSIVMAQTTDTSIISTGNFDGFYTYALHYTTLDWGDLTSWADVNGKIFAPSVGPGYIDDRAGRLAPNLDRQNGVTYDEMWRAAISSSPQRVSITSFNEWHEGSQIEPADPNKISSDGYDYIDYRPNLDNFYLMKTRYWTDQFLGISDRLSPTIEIATPTSDSHISTKDISFIITDNIAVNASTIQVKINGVISSTFDLVDHCTSSVLSTVSCSYMETGIVDGTNTLTIDVRDASGNSAATASTTFTYSPLEIKGLIKYTEKSDMSIQPLNYVKIELDDDQDPQNGILGSTNTRYDGNFNIQIQDKHDLNTLYIRVYADSIGSIVDKVRVNDVDSSDTYYYTASISKSSFNWIDFSDGKSNDVFNIYSNILRSYEYFSSNINPGKITINLNNLAQTGVYSNSKISINFNNYVQTHNNIELYHEYGHFVMDTPHNVLYDIPILIYDAKKNRDLTIYTSEFSNSEYPWIEGWAVFTSAIVNGNQRFWIGEYLGIDGYVDFEDAQVEVIGIPIALVPKSDKNVIRNSAFLWDLYDGKGGLIIENEDQFDGGYDISLILDVLKNEKEYDTKYGTSDIYSHKTPLNVAEFYEGWISSNKPHIKELTKLVKHHFKDGYAHIILNSPANLHIYDSNDNHIGVNKVTGDVDREIIGSYYSGPDSHPEEIFLMTGNHDEKYELIIEGTGAGTFTLIYESAFKGVTSIASYENILVNLNSVGYISDKMNSGNHIMRMDYDGNGIIDYIILPTSIAISGDNLYNITFLPPITTMDQYSLKDGSTLPIKFTARNSTTDEFIYDDTVNVTITNSTGHLITYFTNGTGTDSVRINTEDEQYIANFHSKNYDLNVGETYAVTVTFGESDSLRGYDMTYFDLVERGKGKK